MKKVIKTAVLLASVAIPLAVYSQNNSGGNTAPASPVMQNSGGGQPVGQVSSGVPVGGQNIPPSAMGQGQPVMNNGMNNMPANMGGNMGDSTQNAQSGQKQPPIFEFMNEIQSIAQETKDPNTKQRLQVLQNRMSDMVKRRQEMQQQNNMQGGGMNNGMGQMPNANMNNGQNGQMMPPPPQGQMPPQQGMQGSAGGGSQPTQPTGK